jgi:hypothetical protein
VDVGKIGAWMSSSRRRSRALKSGLLWSFARIACSSDTAIDLLLNLQSQLRLWSDRLLSDLGDDGNGEAR